MIIVYIFVNVRSLDSLKSNYRLFNRHGINIFNIVTRNTWKPSLLIENEEKHTYCIDFITKIIYCFNLILMFSLLNSIDDIV